MKTKICSKCRYEQPVAEFFKRATAKDNLRSHCRTCEKAAQRKRIASGRMKIARDKWSHSEKGRRSVQTYRHVHRRESREKSLRLKYGITIKQYDKILAAQNGVCGICGCSPENNKRRLSVDHNHKTKIVRGLLCVQCNVLLGFLEKIERTGFVLDANRYRKNS